jgi:hypothetical protein
MRGSLGEKIGEGAWSDVHAWAPGQVVKLFKAGFPRRHSWWEARMTRAAFAAGAPAPEVFDEVTVEGRFGVVLHASTGLLWRSCRGAAPRRLRKRARSSLPLPYPFTGRRRLRTYSRCATRRPVHRGSPAACFRSTSPLASSP